MSDRMPRGATNRRHIAFPLRLDARGRTAVSDDEVYLKGLVEQVLFTAPGERVNRPDFGSGIARLVFAPSGDALASTTEAMVQGALQHWLGDLIRVESVAVRAVESRLDVVVEYSPLHGSTAQVRTITVGGGIA